MEKIFAGARIRALRTSQGLSQTTMAKTANLSASYLNQLENNQRPLTATALMALCRAFGVEPSFFSPEPRARTVADLQSALVESGVADIPLEDITDLVDRHPELARSLLALGTRTRQPDAYELVRDYFYQRSNYIDRLDRVAEEFAEGLKGPGLRIARLVGILDEQFEVRVRFQAFMEGPKRVFDPHTRLVSLRMGLTEAQQFFELCMQYVFLAHADLLAELSAEGDFPDDAARRLCEMGLAQYFAAAVTMPYTQFLAAAGKCQYDIDQLAAQFGTSFETTCHRLSTLQRAGARGIPFFFVRTDRAGNISKRQSATAFHFSRSGGSCPLWVVHRAFETPGRIVRQVSVMPDGRAYLWIARTVRTTAQRFGSEPKDFAIGLGCDLNFAHQLVYSTGLDISPQAATPIGAGCRVCERAECAQRAFPAAGLDVLVDPNVTPDKPYRTAVQN